jgi:undecaprenyl-phosphate 4-deoxy-4-formamido-L-arabinose transferase
MALDELVSRTAATLDGPGRTWELILVNDGSPPDTWRRIERLSDKYPAVRGINLRRNFGQQNGLLAGICASRGRAIVTLDDDLQHPPEQVPRLVAALESGVDVVYGSAVHPQHGRGRALGARAVRAVLRGALGSPAGGHVTAFRAFRGELREVFADHRGPHVSIDVLLNWATSRVTAVPVAHEPRRHGRSQYRVGPLLALATSMVTGLSPWPLRLAGVVGLAVTALGALLLAVAVGRSLAAPGGASPGAVLAAVLALSAGAQLLAIGIVGEYLARIYFRSMGRPAYVIESVTGEGSEERRGDG